jgi:hypothetical protein
VSAAVCLSGHLLLQAPADPDLPSSEQQNVNKKVGMTYAFCRMGTLTGPNCPAPSPSGVLSSACGVMTREAQSYDTVTVTADCRCHRLLCLLDAQSNVLRFRLNRSAVPGQPERSSWRFVLLFTALP